MVDRHWLTLPHLDVGGIPEALVLNHCVRLSRVHSNIQHLRRPLVHFSIGCAQLQLKLRRLLFVKVRKEFPLLFAIVMVLFAFLC